MQMSSSFVPHSFANSAPCKENVTPFKNWYNFNRCREYKGYLAAGLLALLPLNIHYGKWTSISGEEKKWYSSGAQRAL